MNDEAPRQGRPATYLNTTAANRTTHGGQSGGGEWPRCPYCDARFPAPKYVDRHLVRTCLGDASRPLVRRLPRPHERKQAP